MEIREPRSGDIPSLITLVLGVYAENPSSMWFTTTPSEADLRDLFEKKLRDVAGKVMVDVVAEEHGGIVGECEIVRGELNVGIVGVIVKRGYRAMGIGTALLNEAERRAKELGIIALRADVSKKNRSAADFFTDLGFELVKMPGDPRKPEGTQVFERRIQ